MTADDAPGPVHGQARGKGSASRRELGSPGQLPAVISHLSAICRARQNRGVTADMQAIAPGRYAVTVCNGRKELSLTFSLRRRSWDLADVQLTEDGKPTDAARSMYEVIRLLSGHEIGTGTPSRTGAQGDTQSRLPGSGVIGRRLVFWGWRAACAGHEAPCRCFRHFR